MFKIYNDRDQLWQWDVGQRLIVGDGLPCSEVHFCNGTSDCSLVCEIYEEDGLRLVDVPNIFLQTTKIIKVFAYVCNGDDHHTQISKYFTVTPRSKPADYVYTETEVKTFAKLEERMNALEESVSAEGVAKAVEDYLTENPPQSGATVEEAKQIAQNKQNIEKLSEEKLDSSKLSDSIKTALGYTPADAEELNSKLDADKLPEAVNDALAQAKASGEFDGEDGQNGKDGTSVTVQSVNESAESGGSNVVTFSDEKTLTVKNGKDGKDGQDGQDGQDGDDYVLTEADKQEIAEQAAGLIDTALLTIIGSGVTA